MLRLPVTIVCAFRPFLRWIELAGVEIMLPNQSVIFINTFWVAQSYQTFWCHCTYASCQVQKNIRRIVFFLSRFRLKTMTSFELFCKEYLLWNELRNGVGENKCIGNILWRATDITELSVTSVQPCVQNVAGMINAACPTGCKNRLQMQKTTRWSEAITDFAWCRLVVAVDLWQWGILGNPRTNVSKSPHMAFDFEKEMNALNEFIRY